MIIALDTNIVLTLLNGEPAREPALALIDRTLRTGRVLVSGVVFAELCAHPRSTPEWIEEFLTSAGMEIDFDWPDEWWREAAMRNRAYADRRRASKGGLPRRLLADLMIGIHAVNRADALMSLDQERIPADFPELRIIRPGTRK